MNTTHASTTYKPVNPYLDINFVDRTDQINSLFDSTLRDIKADPEYYAELVNDLLFHWIYNTRETRAMNNVKKSIVNAIG